MAYYSPFPTKKNNNGWITAFVICAMCILTLALLVMQNRKEVRVQNTHPVIFPTQQPASQISWPALNKPVDNLDRQNAESLVLTYICQDKCLAEHRVIYRQAPAGEVLSVSLDTADCNLNVSISASLSAKSKTTDRVYKFVGILADKNARQEMAGGRIYISNACHVEFFFEVVSTTQTL